MTATPCGPLALVWSATLARDLAQVAMWRETAAANAREARRAEALGFDTSAPWTRYRDALAFAREWLQVARRVRLEGATR